jgi:hypothetical protein
MPYFAPATSTVKRSPRHRTGTRTIVCLSCGDTMKHLRTIAKLGVSPERLIFVCPSCKGVATKELKRVA